MASKCWPYSLEHHRDMNMVTQAKELFNTGHVDDVIVANCFASEAELKAFSEVNKEVLIFDVELIKNLPEVETKLFWKKSILTEVMSVLV